MIKLFVFIIFAGRSWGQDPNQINTQYITEKNTSLKLGTKQDLNPVEVTSEPTLKVNNNFSKSLQRLKLIKENLPENISQPMQNPTTTDEISSYFKKKSESSNQNCSCPDLYENLSELNRRQDIINQNVSMLEKQQIDLDEKHAQFETEKKKLDESLIQLEFDKRNIAEANWTVENIRADIEYYRTILIQQINYYEQSNYDVEQQREYQETYRLQLEKTRLELIDKAKELNNKEQELKNLDLDCSRSKSEEINHKLKELEKGQIKFNKERTQFEDDKMKLTADLLQLEIDQKLIAEANDDLENRTMELEYNLMVLNEIKNNYTQSYYELQQRIDDQEKNRLRMEKDHDDFNKRIRETQPCNRNCLRLASNANQVKLDKQKTEMNQYQLALEEEQKKKIVEAYSNEAYLEEMQDSSKETTKLANKEELEIFSQNLSHPNNDETRLRLDEENTEINQVTSKLEYEPRELDDEQLLLENEEKKAAVGLESLEIDKKYLPEADSDIDIE